MRPTCSTASSTTKPNCRSRITLPTRLATRILVFSLFDLSGLQFSPRLRLPLPSLSPKLQSFRRQNVLTRALQEYGRLNKTIFILRYLLDESFQRRIGAQINKGEALHALRGFLFVANEGKIRHHYDEEQLNQVSCLNLVTNAVVLWNTVYMSAVLDQLRSEGHNVDAGDVVHLSPARYSHINPYGKYRFNVEGEFNRKGLRPLRQPDSAAA
jgi:rRNA maturation protein Nop10